MSEEISTFLIPNYMKNIFTHVMGDIFGGITAGIVALPLALAFGVSSGLGPDALRHDAGKGRVCENV